MLSERISLTIKSAAKLPTNAHECLEVLALHDSVQVDVRAAMLGVASGNGAIIAALRDTDTRAELGSHSHERAERAALLTIVKEGFLCEPCDPAAAINRLEALISIPRTGVRPPEDAYIGALQHLDRDLRAEAGRCLCGYSMQSVEPLNLMDIVSTSPHPSLFVPTWCAVVSNLTTIPPLGRTPSERDCQTLFQCTSYFCSSTDDIINVMSELTTSAGGIRKTRFEALYGHLGVEVRRYTVLDHLPAKVDLVCAQILMCRAVAGRNLLNGREERWARGLLRECQSPALASAGFAELVKWTCDDASPAFEHLPTGMAIENSCSDIETCGPKAARFAPALRFMASLPCFDQPFAKHSEKLSSTADRVDYPALNLLNQEVVTGGLDLTPVREASDLLGELSLPSDVVSEIRMRYESKRVQFIDHNRPISADPESLLDTRQLYVEAQHVRALSPNSAWYVESFAVGVFANSDQLNALRAVCITDPIRAVVFSPIRSDSGWERTENFLTTTPEGARLRYIAFQVDNQDQLLAASVLARKVFDVLTPSERPTIEIWAYHELPNLPEFAGITIVRSDSASRRGPALPGRVTEAMQKLVTGEQEPAV